MASREIACAEVNEKVARDNYLALLFGIPGMSLRAAFVAAKQFPVKLGIAYHCVAHVGQKQERPRNDIVFLYDLLSHYSRRFQIL